MAAKPYSEWTLAKLEAEKAKIEQAIDEARERDRQTALASLQSVAAKHGFELAELVAETAVGERGRAKRAKPKAKVAPKYRNPNDPTQTWSGRGRTPRWMTEHVEAGGNREDLGIQ